MCVCVCLCVCVCVCVCVCAHPSCVFLCKCVRLAKVRYISFPLWGSYFPLHIHRSKSLPWDATVMPDTAKFACNPCLRCAISWSILHSVEDYLSRLNAKLVFEVLADPKEQHGSHGLRIINDANNLHNYPNNNNTVQFGGLSALLAAQYITCSHPEYCPAIFYRDRRTDLLKLQ